MKRILSLVLALVIVLGTMPMAFAEVEMTKTAGEELKAAGFVQGDEEGNLMEDKSLTRAELCVLVAELNGVKEIAKAYAMPANFSDVAADAWFAPYVAYATDQGWFKGLGDGQFGPAGEVTGQMLATVMMRALGHTPNWDTAVAEAAALGLTVDAKGETMTRGEAFGTMWQTVNTPKKGSDVKLGVELGKIKEEVVVVEDLVATIDNAKSIANNLVEVKYTEAVDAAAAGMASNYTIVEKDDATKELAVVAATVEGEKLVVLETEAMTAGTAYTVVVGESKDNFSGIKKVTSAPKVDSVKGTDQGEVKVVFEDALVDKATVEDVANYSIDKEGTVVAAAINADRDSVTLTIEGITSTSAKKLTIENVTSTDGVVIKKVTRAFGPKFDKVAPKIDKVYPSKENNVEVIVDFTDSHGVDEATANDVANYSIDGLEILEAKAIYQDGDNDDYMKRVVLTTSEQTKSKKYTLKVLYMMDGSTAKNATTKTLEETFRGGTADSTEPKVASVTPQNLTEVYVTFTEHNSLDLATALDAGNYTFKDDALDVVGVALDDADENGNSYDIDVTGVATAAGGITQTGDDKDSITVVLTVSEIEVGTYYRLKINNIADNFGNVIDKEIDKSVKIATSAEVKAYSQIKSISCTDLEKVVVTFENDVKKASAQDPTNYVIDGVGAVKKASRTGAVVTLTVPKLTENKTYTLTVNGVENYWGFATEDVTKKFIAIKDGVDTTQPEVEGVEYTNYGELRLTFSEAMKASATAGGTLSTVTVTDPATASTYVLAYKGSLEDDTVLVFDSSFVGDSTATAGTVLIPATLLDTELDITSFANVTDTAGNTVDYTADTEDYITAGEVIPVTDRVSNDGLSQENGNVIHATFDRKIEDLAAGATITANKITIDGTAKTAPFSKVTFNIKRDSDDSQLLIMTAQTKFDDKTWELEFDFSTVVTDILGRSADTTKVTIDVDNDDETGPAVTEVQVIDKRTLKVFFDEKLSIAGSYTITDLDKTTSNTVGNSATLKDPTTTGNVVQLDLTKDLTAEHTYELKYGSSKPRDLNGNKVEDEDETFEFVGSDVAIAKDSVTAKVNSANEVVITSTGDDFTNAKTLNIGAKDSANAVVVVSGTITKATTATDELTVPVLAYYSLLSKTAAGKAVTYTITTPDAAIDTATHTFQTFTGIIEEDGVTVTVATATDAATIAEANINTGDTVLEPTGMVFDKVNFDYAVIDSADNVLANNAAILGTSDNKFVLPVAGDTNVSAKLVAYPKGQTVVEFITKAFTY